MRIAELVLRALAKELEAETKRQLDYENAEQILIAIDDKVKQIRNTDRGPQRDSLFDFYQNMQRDIRACLDLWRNRCDHARETYSEKRAEDAWQHVEGMTRRYALWLLEKEKKKHSTE